LATVRDLLTAAYQEISVLAEGETLSAAAASDALNMLNRMIDQWKAENLQIYAVTRTTATLTASQASFTVGASGNINIARPVFIEKVNFIDTATDPDHEYQLPQLLTEAEWAGISQKALTSTYPQCAYYSPTYPTGTLYPWPIPTSSTLQWAVYHWAAVAAYSDLSDSVALPPGYEELIVTQMATRLAASNGRAVDPDLRHRASQAKQIVQRANFRMNELGIRGDALIGSPSRFDIHTGY
jgi:hypothetical protein